jgi:hypothetical protein
MNIKKMFGYKRLVEEEDESDIYFAQMKPILEIIWRLGKIYELPPSERFAQLVNKLGEVYILQHFWKQSDVLVNLEHSMGDYSTIERNSFGENMRDFCNAAKIQLKPYVQEFLNHNL